MSHCDLCGVSLGSDPEAYRCGEAMTCVRHLQDNLQKEWSSNKNNVANYQLQVQELQARLVAAEGCGGHPMTRWWLFLIIPLSFVAGFAAGAACVWAVPEHVGGTV